MATPPLPPLPPPPPFEQFDANRGVRLFYLADGCAACHIGAQAQQLNGQDDLRMQPIRLPQLPSSMVEICAGIARALWRSREAQSIIVFYLDVANGMWCPVMPQQTCSRVGIHCQLTGAGFPALAATHRLAGTFRALLLDDVDIEAEIPAHDGVHVFFDLEADWIRLATFHRVGGRVVAERAEEVIRNESVQFLQKMLPQLRIVPAGWDGVD